MTVSRVLNNFAGVRPETRTRVERAIHTLGYRVNSAARTLAGGRSHILGVVSVETNYYGWSELLFGVEAAARVSDKRVMFVTLRRPDEAELDAALRHLSDAHVDGAIVIAPVQAATKALAELDHDMPVVALCGAALPGETTIAIDQRRGAQLATEHLLELGHDTVHHISGPTQWIDAAGRVEGWRATLRASGVRPPKPLVGDWSAASGYELGRRLLADPHVTAIFVANDQMALGVLLACRDVGRRVPEDVSIVGFDDTPEAAYFLPPLTTVRQELTELGRRGADLLLSMVDGDTPAAHVAIEPGLVVRESTSGPRT